MEKQKEHNLNWAKKAVLFAEIGRVKNFFLPLTLPHSRMCTRIYIFCLKKYTHKQKTEKQKETKEKKKENAVVVKQYLPKI